MGRTRGKPFESTDAGHRRPRNSVA